MRQSYRLAAALAASAGLVSAASIPASAECERYGFLVNDYGKDGPTKDAKDLLDKMIATKMAEKGVKDYKTGTKSVSCELFLNFIVFDEHTCTARATVCWGGSSLPSSEQSNADASDDAVAPTKTSSGDEGASKPIKKKKKEAVAKASENTESESAKPAEKQHDHKMKAATIPDPKSSASAETKEKSKSTAAAESSPDTASKSADSDTAATKSSASKASDSATTLGSTTAKADATSQPSSTDAAPTPTTAQADKKSDEKSGDKVVKPVETGSLADPAKKAAKHKAKSVDSDDSEPTTPSAPEAGYPTPQGPQPGDVPPPSP